MTRSRKSREYGFGIVPPESNQPRQIRSLTTLWESSRFKTSGKCSKSVGRRVPMGSVLNLRRSEYSVVWLPTEPSGEATMPPPDNQKNDRVPGDDALPGMRDPRARARFLVAG